MTRRRVALILLVLFTGLSSAAEPAGARPAPGILVFGAGGHLARHADPVPAWAELSAVPGGSARAARTAADRRRRAVAADRTVRSELLRLVRSHAISLGAYHHDRAVFENALATERRLSGTRADELAGVLAITHDIAASGQLTPSRLPAIFLTLERNRQWWTTGSLLSSGDRVGFAGSEIVWEYYPGSGIQLQVLGSFGKADGLYTSGPRGYRRARKLIDEMVPLASRRGGGLTWEYYFPFDGGDPPWTSAMSQATGLEALTRAYRASHDISYLEIGHQALPILATAPPLGVASPAGPGRTWYLLYSFAPGAHVINGFLQTLIGLYDYARASHDRRAAALFAAGDREARSSVGAFDTGGWSLYQPGELDSLDYHQLVTGFAQGLCDRTHAAAYCTTAARFASYLKTPPALRLVTTRARAALPITLGFTVDKPAHVGIIVLRGSRTIFSTSADFDGGAGSFAIGQVPGPGAYTIRLGATDLAGNFGHIVGTLNAT